METNLQHESYTITQATSEINRIVNKYSEPEKNCSATYYDTGVNIENSYVEYPRVESWNDSATSAFIDFKTEKRPIIVIGSKIWEIWGMR